MKSGSLKRTNKSANVSLDRLKALITTDPEFYNKIALTIQKAWKNWKQIREDRLNYRNLCKKKHKNIFFSLYSKVLISLKTKSASKSRKERSVL